MGLHSDASTLFSRSLEIDVEKIRPYKKDDRRSGADESSDNLIKESHVNQVLPNQSSLSGFSG